MLNKRTIFDLRIYVELSVLLWRGFLSPMLNLLWWKLCSCPALILFTVTLTWLFSIAEYSWPYRVTSSRCSQILALFQKAMQRRKTFNRWASGKVKWFLSALNAQALSQIGLIIVVFAKGEFFSYSITVITKFYNFLSGVFSKWIITGKFFGWLIHFEVWVNWKKRFSPWINNCVGERNQKYFVLFCCYIALISIHALFLCVNQFALCIKHEWKECSTFSPPATVVLLLFLIFEALLFCIFTMIMLGTQLNAIWNDETGIEQLKKEEARWVKKSRWKSIESVFGRFSILWLSPFSQPNIKSKMESCLYPV